MEQETLSFKDKYKQCSNWSDKAITMSLYHTIMQSKYKDWNVKDTATHFGVSHGLASENIRLAKEIDAGNKKVKDAPNRDEALKHIERRGYSRDRKEYVMFKMDD